MSLRWRLLILIMLASGLILCAVIMHNASFARRALSNALKDRAGEMAAHAAAAIDARLTVAARSVEIAAVENSINRAYLRRVTAGNPYGEAFRRLRRLLASSPELYGATIAIDPSVPGFSRGYSPYLHRNETAEPAGTEPAAKNPSGKGLSEQNYPEPPSAAPDLFRADSGKANPAGDGSPEANPPETELAEVNLATDAYRYPIQDWYLVPRELDRPMWGEPAFDEGGCEKVVVTYSVPFRFGGAGAGGGAADGKADGVQTGDITLDWLDDSLRNLPLRDNDYAFLVSRFGTVIAHPDGRWVMSETLFSLAASHHNPDIAAWARELQNHESGITQVEGLFGAKTAAWVAHRPVPSTGWTMIAILSQGEAQKETHSLVIAEVEIGILGLLLLLAAGLMIAESITKPLRRLTLATKEMIHGNLDHPLPVAHGGDEVADLTRHFASMRGELKRYMDNLQQAAAARERIESELRIANTIQHSFLPAELPKERRFDVAAKFEPAREVGGDLYDVQLDKEEGRLYLVIGDVSGKGMPSALFMARTISLWRHLLTEHRLPEEILAALNRELARENPSWYFITMFCVVVELPAGMMYYASAGHPPQAFRRANGECVWLGTEEEVPPAFPLGLEESAVYQGRSRHLTPGDLLVLFTDGVNEAENAGHEQLGEEPILAALKNDPEDCAAALQEVRQLVARHVDGAEQSDDLTLTAFRYLGGEGEDTVTTQMGEWVKEWRPAETYLSGDMLDWLEGVAGELHLKAQVVNEMGVALDELLNNSVEHGKAGRMAVELALQSGWFEARVIDDGPEFNPLDLPEPDINAPLEERPIGGLGVFLARRLTDRLEWKRAGGENVVTLWKWVG